MPRFIATIHPDQSDRKKYADELFNRLAAFYKEHGAEEADKLLATEDDKRAFIKDAIDRWGEDYAIRLWNAALQKVVIQMMLDGEDEYEE